MLGASLLLYFSMTTQICSPSATVMLPGPANERHRTPEARPARVAVPKVTPSAGSSGSAPKRRQEMRQSELVLRLGWIQVEVMSEALRMVVRTAHVPRELLPSSMVRFRHMLIGLVAVLLASSRAPKSAAATAASETSRTAAPRRSAAKRLARNI